MNILTKSNSKLIETSKLNKAKIYQFNLPAYKTESGKITCPYASDCVKYCYASKGTFRFKNVQNKYNKNYNLSLIPEFIDLINIEIKQFKPSHIRIHSSGDFYSIDYLLKWITIAADNPEVIFYGYTKSIPFFKHHKIKPMLNQLSNFKFVFSTGSKKDNLINFNKDYHAVIFDNKNDLLNAGYIDASKNDLIAINPDNNKIGLIYH